MMIDVDFALSSDERLELDRLDSEQRELETRTRLRSAILTNTPHDSLRVAMRLHLLERDAEEDLRHRLGLAESKWMLLSHHLPGYEDEYRAATQDRAHLIEQFAAASINVSVDVGRSPSGDARRSMNTNRTIRSAATTVATIRAAAVGVVDAALEAGLLGPDDSPERPGGCPPHVRVADGRPETRARAETVATELRRLGVLNDQLIQRVHFEAGRAARAAHGIGDRLTQQRVRRNQACATLDLIRSMHAAIAEVEAACANYQPRG